VIIGIGFLVFLGGEIGKIQKPIEKEFYPVTEKPINSHVSRKELYIATL